MYTSRFISGLIFLLFISFCSCSKWTVPTELVGTWRAENAKVVVRSDLGWMKFKFTEGFADAEITINTDKSVTGRIGPAKFSKGVIKKNGGDPEKTGVAYNIKCWWIGKIFSNDPEPSKGVELWMGPVKDGKAKAGLRLTENGSQFPMGDFIFVKQKE